jgi:hypothetical protein
MTFKREILNTSSHATLQFVSPLCSENEEGREHSVWDGTFIAPKELERVRKDLQ